MRASAGLAGIVRATMAEKRPRGSPTGISPQQREKRAVSRLHGQRTSRRKLAFSSVRPDLNVWTNEEHALVDYLLSQGFHESWPQTKRMDFWEGAAHFVKKSFPSRSLRTSKEACMHKFFCFISFLWRICMFTGFVQCDHIIIMCNSEAHK